jgi:hypothetical protein
MRYSIWFIIILAIAIISTIMWIIAYLGFILAKSIDGAIFLILGLRHPKPMKKIINRVILIILLSPLYAHGQIAESYPVINNKKQPGILILNNNTNEFILYIKYDYKKAIQETFIKINKIYNYDHIIYVCKIPGKISHAYIEFHENTIRILTTNLDYKLTRMPWNAHKWANDIIITNKKLIDLTLKRQP